MRLLQAKIGLFHHIKTSELTGKPSVDALHSTIGMLLRMIDLALYPHITPKTRTSARKAEKKIKEFALLGFKQAMDFYKGILEHSFEGFLDMKTQLQCSFNEIASKTEDSEFLFHFANRMEFDEAMKWLTPLTKKTDKFAVKAALRCVRLITLEMLAQPNGIALNREYEAQFDDWFQFAWENIHELSSKERAILKILLQLKQNKSDEKFEKDLEDEAKAGNPSASFFLASCAEDNIETTEERNKVAELYSAILMQPQVSPNMATVVTHKLAILKCDLAMLKKTVISGYSESAYELGVAALKQDNMDANALEYFNLSLAQGASPHSLRTRICRAIIAQEKIYVQRYMHYYFKLCMDCLSDYRCVFRDRNSQMYLLVIAGLEKLQLLRPKDDALKKLQIKWQEAEEKCKLHNYCYRHLDTQLDADNAMNEIIVAAESVLNPKEEIRKRARLY